ncbi:hypothetical protein X975_01165, partial [Stegodyphus mimosarum]
MSPKQCQHCYNMEYKLRVMAYAKEHRNKTLERHFRPPPTEKIIRTWRNQEEDLKKATRSKHNQRKGTAQWPDLEGELNIGF